MIIEGRLLSSVHKMLAALDERFGSDAFTVTISGTDPDDWIEQETLDISFNRNYHPITISLQYDGDVVVNKGDDDRILFPKELYLDTLYTAVAVYIQRHTEDVLAKYKNMQLN